MLHECHQVSLGAREGEAVVLVGVFSCSFCWLVCWWCSFFPFLLQFGTRVQAVNATAPGVMSVESFSREGEGWCFVCAQAA